jgi:hypothetical protein
MGHQLFFLDGWKLDCNVHNMTLCIYIRLYKPCRPWPLFQFLNLYTVCRTPWKGDQPVARPLHKQEQHKHRCSGTSEETESLLIRNFFDIEMFCKISEMWEYIRCKQRFPYQITSVLIFSFGKVILCRSQWPRGLRHKLSSIARTLGSWVRMPLKAWMSVCVYSSACR